MLVSMTTIIPISECTSLNGTIRFVASEKTRRRRLRKNMIAVEENIIQDRPAVGTLTRTKSLLHAALRVWELKQRISD